MTCELGRVEGIPVIKVGGGNRYTSYLTRVVVGVSVGDASSESTKVVFIGFTTRHSRATLAPLSQSGSPAWALLVICTQLSGNASGTAHLLPSLTSSSRSEWNGRQLRSFAHPGLNQ